MECPCPFENRCRTPVHRSAIAPDDRKDFAGNIA
jgi:hypothetical protein